MERPLGNLVFMRILMEPLRQHLGKQIELAREAWDFMERARHAEALSEGRPYQRRYRVLEVAEGHNDALFYARLNAMFQEA